MYVCICKAVTDKEIRRAAATGVGNLYELQDALGVAMHCGSCADLAESILNENQAAPSHAGPRMFVPSLA